MTDLNALRQYMDFARSQHLFDIYNPTQPTGGFEGGGFQATTFNVPKMIADWAMSQAGGGGGGQDGYGPSGGSSNRMPDYFGGSGGSQGGPQGGYAPSAYVQPQQFQGKFQMPQAEQQPMTGQVNNYLAQLMRGRR